MPETPQPIEPRSAFFNNVPPDFVTPRDPAERLLLREYGAVFVARGGVVAPNRIVFHDETDVAEFQSRLNISRSLVGEFKLELQTAAMDALQSAVGDAMKAGLDITPRGADSARRNYADTIELWRSRVEPALDHWLAQGRISSDQADHIRSLSPYHQVPEVLALETEGIYFAKDLAKSIIYSVAPPGASQHLSLLAFDVSEFDDPRIRELLTEHFWYQTVTSDLPHFTFLGVPERDLPRLGLKQVRSADRHFWIPEI